MQDSIVGVALPAPLGAMYRDLLSPYCPGLSLASCPSPQADSLRKAIAFRFYNGETPEAITEALVVDYGPGIRGSPSMDGFGSAAFFVPVLLLLAGALFAARWIRRNTRRAVMLFVVLGSVQQSACTSRDTPAIDNAGVAVSAATPDTVWASGAWIRTGVTGATTGGYATIHNPRDTAVQIVGATSAVSDTVELHETMEHDGMVHMTPQPALQIPSKDSVVLAPGGKHFMMTGLRRDLVIGEPISVTLQFGDGTSMSLSATVRPITGL
jgi:copper(I)-binding protein/cytochrome c-type biogenesis protein CcmH/NrfF